MSGQSIMDRMQAARHSIAGQGLAKSVCKATTEEIIGPKKKHLDYLLQCTNEPNVSIPQLADLLIERTQHQNWIVVYKSLITIHNLMNYGNERFTQYLASNNCTFNMGGSVDKSGIQGMVNVTGFDMSMYVQRYAKYLNEKATSYRQMAFDFCKVKRGKDDGLLRQMNSDKLLKSLPILQAQLNALIGFDCTPNELTNGVINACFMLLFKDLIRLFACYNDGIINLLEKYFDMNKKQCKEGLDVYKKFLVSMDKVSEFLKVAETVGIDPGDIPDLAKAPASLLDALEQHLNSLEGKKGAVVTTSTAKPAGFASALTTISNNSSALNVSEDEKKRILDEENQRLHQLKVEQRLKELQTNTTTSPTTTSPVQTNPFNTPGPAKQVSVDLFGPNSPTTQGVTPSAATNGRPSDDLLSLSTNPFQQNVEAVMATAYSQPTQSTNPFASNTGSSWNNANTSNFGNEVDFAKAFNNTAATPQGFDAFGEVLQPHNKQNTIDISQQKTDASGKIMAGDLNTSLSSLAGNLHIGGPAQQVKKAEHQWNPKGEQKLTGGTNWQVTGPAMATTWNQAPPPTTGVQYQQQQQQQQQQQMMGGQMMAAGYAQAPGMMPAGQPMMGMAQPQMVGMNMGMQQAPMYAAGARMQQPMGFQQARPPVAQQSNPGDPFGAL